MLKTIRRARDRTLGLIAGAAAWLLGGASALAETDPMEIDPRLEGYARGVSLPEKGNTSLTYILLIFLMLITVAVLFKNAKRTHLD
jgi:hypothetical protein